MARWENRGGSAVNVQDGLGYYYATDLLPLLNAYAECEEAAQQAFEAEQAEMYLEGTDDMYAGPALQCRLAWRRLQDSFQALANVKGEGKWASSEFLTS